MAQSRTAVYKWQRLLANAPNLAQTKTLAYRYHLLLTVYIC